MLLSMMSRCLSNLCLLSFQQSHLAGGLFSCASRTSRRTPFMMTTRCGEIMVDGHRPSECMPVRTEKDLSEQLRVLWLKAIAAIELRNFDYAISLLQGVLKQEPEFLMGRQLLRRAEVTKHKGDKKALFKIPMSAISIMKAERTLKKDPRQAMEMIEKVLEDEPYHRRANLVLKEAALAAGCPEIGVFALQTLLEGKTDPKILHELGRLYRELGENEKEVEVYHRITEIDPTDTEADRLAKDASARASMKAGGWTRAESDRERDR